MSQTHFLNWARQSLVPLSTVTPGPPWNDLAPLGKMIGDATVVALSEGVHCAAEPLEFRNRLFQYLVQEKGLTAIAIESGIAESRVVHDYVRGNAGDLDAVLAQGLSWTFDCLPQNRSLVQWLRQYNADPRHTRKLNFYGFDLSGSPGNHEANRGVDTALTETLKFLARVDSAAAVEFRARLEPFLRRIRVNFRPSKEGPGYESLTQAERDTVTATIEDMIALVERKEAACVEASSSHDYEWGYRVALDARCADAWLRYLPVDLPLIGEKEDIPAEVLSILAEARDTRDREQADNIDWILKQEGPTGKILVFAARYHLSTAAVKGGTHYENGEERAQEVAGTYMRRRLGERLVTIGNSIEQGTSGCGNYRHELERAPPDSVDGIAAQIGVPLFALDLRAAPADARQWFAEERRLAHPSVFKMKFGRAFDILLHMAMVEAACGQSADVSP